MFPHLFQVLPFLNGRRKDGVLICFKYFVDVKDVVLHTFGRK